MSDQTFTGRARRRKTRMSVRLADTTARVMITVGGIGTIVAVATVCVFLVAVVMPLFRPASTELAAQHRNPQPGRQPVRLAVDEYQTIGIACGEDGTLTTFRLDDGSVLATRSLIESGEPTAWSFSYQDDTVIAGLADGTLRAFRIGFRTDFLADQDVPEHLLDLGDGELAPFQDGIVQLTPEGQLRLQTLT
ncbi:MAG: hypothetical protein ACYTGC_18780, partial [Planctomycetota bacterium]